MIEDIEKEFDNLKINSIDDLNSAKVKFLGKNGLITSLLKEIKNIEVCDKKTYGEKINLIKTKMEMSFSNIEKNIVDKILDDKIKQMPLIDLTMPANYESGSLHPITIVGHNVINIFKSMGFSIEDGNEIETEFNNFEAVNIPKEHPARDMQDTFYLENGEVLKTHTSASQNRIMKKYGAPLKVIFPGRCFRNEELDASHENTFWQLEGMVIDKNISISNLIYFMKAMLSKIFKKDVLVRLRPGFFPFVEPGFELDCSCPFCGGKGCSVCKNGGWIELCPCGMIHPAVLEKGGINTDEYQGFAFGLGLSRLSMMTFDIKDIRLLNSGNLKVLKQAKIK